MKRPNIERLEQLEKASTEGPWKDTMYLDENKDNVDFIVEAKNQMPALLEYVKTLEEHVDEITKILRGVAKQTYYSLPGSVEDARRYIRKLDDKI